MYAPKRFVLRSEVEIVAMLIVTDVTRMLIVFVMTGTVLNATLILRKVHDRQEQMPQFRARTVSQRTGLAEAN